MLGVTILILGDAVPEPDRLPVAVARGQRCHRHQHRRQRLFLGHQAHRPQPDPPGRIPGPAPDRRPGPLFLHEAIGFWAWAGIFLTMSGILWVVTEHQPQQSHEPARPGLRRPGRPVPGRGHGHVPAGHGQHRNHSPVGRPHPPGRGQPDAVDRPAPAQARHRAAPRLLAGHRHGQKRVGSSPWPSSWARSWASGCSRPPSS
jgi:hypothetical protein